MEIMIANFIGHIIDIFGILMILYLTIKQSNNDIVNIFVIIIYLFCIIMNHIVKYIMYESLKKEEQKYERIK